MIFLSCCNRKTFSTEKSIFFNTVQRLPNGDLMGGGVALTNSCEMVYYTRATNTWSNGTQTRDTGSIFPITYKPVKMDDATLLAFRVSDPLSSDGSATPSMDQNRRAGESVPRLLCAR